MSDDLNFFDAPTGGSKRDKPKEGSQFGVIAQVFNEGKKLNTFKNPPEEYISIFAVVQLKETSSDPASDNFGRRKLTRFYFKYNKFEPKPGQKGAPSKMMVLLRGLFGSQLEEIFRKEPSIYKVLEGLPVMVNIKHKPNGGWDTTLAPFPEGVEPLKVEDYTPWEAREVQTEQASPQVDDDSIPF